MKVLVAGTPGVGKTTLSSRMSKRLGIPHVDISRYIEENKLYTEFDEKYKTLMFDEAAVEASLQSHLAGMDSYIIDSHSCGVLRSFVFDLVFVLTLPIETLYKRLKDRGYDDIKIKENIECEIFGVVKEEVEDIFGRNFHTVGEESDDITAEKAMELAEKRAGQDKRHSSA